MMVCGYADKFRFIEGVASEALIGLEADARGGPLLADLRPSRAAAMRTRTCLELNIGAVAKSRESGHWQPSRFGHKPTVANDRFAAVQLARPPSESIGPRTPPPPTIDSGRAVAYRT